MVKVVVIDDEKWIRKLIINLLPVNKYSLIIVGEAEDGEEGLALVNKIKPDIIITDIRMPLLSGLDLIKELNRKQPESKIIIITGYDNFDYAQKAIKSGVVDFLLKPVEESELESAVGKAVREIRKVESLKKTKQLVNQVKRLSQNYIEISDNNFNNISNTKIRKALQYINNNYQNQISLEEVSDFIIMNSSYFSEQFKKEVGTGFNKYIISLRFEKAKELLVQEFDLTIRDIANIVGFTDSNYFSRLFKKNFGCTPQDYRNIKS